MDRVEISLAAARVNAGLSQEKAAERLGVSVSTLRRWEQRPDRMTPDWALRLSRLYNMDIDHIRFVVPDKP